MSEHHSAAYVRADMLPQQAPPVSEIGVVRWLRENLFSGPLNTFLTLSGVFILYFLLNQFFPWFRHSVWSAASVGECRDIITARWGEGATGACWAIIRDRWNMFLFGFYPRELYWRPTLALGLLLFAAAPVLFSESRRIRMIVLGVTTAFLLVAFPGLGVGALATGLLAAALTALLAVAWSRPWALLWLTGIYPGLAVWLLWGGSVWGPVLAMAGFVLAWAAFTAVRSVGAIIVGRLVSRRGACVVASGNGAGGRVSSTRTCPMRSMRCGPTSSAVSCCRLRSGLRASRSACRWGWCWRWRGGLTCCW